MPLQFGPFLLDPDVRALFRSGERLSISSKVFELLVVLVQNRDSVVTKKDLLLALWPDTAVEDANITQTVYTLRKLLADDSKQHRYVATVSGSGYRFIAPVNEVISPSEATSEPTLRPSILPRTTESFLRPTGLKWLIAVAIFATVAFTRAFWPSHPVRTALPELEQRQLTFNSSESAVTSGAISPNGKYLAYTDWTGLHLKNLELGSVQNFADKLAAGGKSVSWSIGGWLPGSDGFVANALVKGTPPALWSVGMAGGLLRKLQDDAFGWSISPDGSTLAFTRDNVAVARHVAGGHEIWTYDFKTGQVSRLVATHSTLRYSGLCWAADGKRIAYIAGGQAPGTLENAIVECDRAGRARRTILTGTNLKSFLLLRNGRLVVSKAEPEPNGTSCNLWVSTGVGERLHRLTDWQGSCLDTLTSNSAESKLALRKYSDQGTTYVAEVLQNGTQISAPVRLNYSKDQQGPAAWLPDNRTLLLASNRKGHWEILKQAVGDQNAQPLVSEENSTGYPSITPDGRWILYLVGPRSLNAGFYWGPVRLMRVPVEGGAPVEVTRLANSDGVQCPRGIGHSCVVIQKSADGRVLVFRSLDPMKGVGRELASYPIEVAGLYNYALSSDGTRMAVAKVGNPPIDVIWLGSRVEHVPATTRHDLRAIAWTPGDEGFFVGTDTPDGAALLEMDLTGKTHVLWDQKGATRTWGVLSPNGRHLAILNWTADSNIWTIEGF